MLRRLLEALVSKVLSSVGGINRAEELAVTGVTTSATCVKWVLANVGEVPGVAVMTEPY